MQPQSGIIFFSVAVIAVTLGEPLFDKLHPNRDERFQMKNAGKCQVNMPISINLNFSILVAKF